MWILSPTPGHDTDVLSLTFYDGPAGVRYLSQPLLHGLFPEIKNPGVQVDKLTNELASLVKIYK